MRGQTEKPGNESELTVFVLSNRPGSTHSPTVSRRRYRRIRIEFLGAGRKRIDDAFLPRHLPARPFRHIGIHDSRTDVD